MSDEQALVQTATANPAEPAQALPAGLAAELMANAREASDFLKAISHETRLIILCLLSDGERTVSELEDMLGLPQAIVSQQLARLRADDIVQTRRAGRQVFYSIRSPEVVTVVQALHLMFCATPARS